MPDKITIPQRIEDITAPWIESILQFDLPDCRVASIDITRIGEGVGFLGELARISIKYGEHFSEGPPSVIAKIATRVAEPRAMAIGLGVYEREVGFYRDLSVKAGARVPHSYCAEVLPDGRFALVLEDFPEAVAGDQIKSCTDEEAYLPVSELAKLHAKWWDSPELVGYSWLPTPGHAFFDIGREAYRQSLSVFRERAGEGFAAILPAANKLEERFDEFLAFYFGNQPLTLVHGDFRLDNLLFNQERGESPLVVLDWQLMQQGPGAADLQYFISGNLRNDARRRLTTDLLRFYHERLCEGGVRDYSLTQCRQDFVAMSAALIPNLVVGMANINPEAYGERGGELIDLLFGSMADAILEYDAERWLP